MKKEIICQLFKNKGLKKTKAIELCNVSRRTFYDYINDRRKATSDFKLRLANYLGVNIDMISN